MFIESILRLGSKDYVSILFSGDYAKLACMRVSTGRRELVSLKSIETRGLGNESIARNIRSWLDEMRVSPSQVIVLFPPHLAITKNIEVPSVNPQEIKDIVDLQAGRHTPYSREEIIIDYINIGSYRKNYTKVLLVIITQNAINRQIDVLTKANLRTSKIFFSPEAVALEYSRIEKTDSSDAVSGLIHIDRSSTDFLCTRKGRVLFIRNISIGTEHFASEQEKCQIRFIDEIKKSLEVYRNEEIDKLPVELVLIGAVETGGDLKRMLSESLHIPTRAVVYLDRIPVLRYHQRDIALTKQTSFFEMISGIALFEKMRVNLIPKEIRLRELFEERSRDLVKAGINTLTIIALLCALLMSRIYFKDTYLHALEQRYSKELKASNHLLDIFSKVELVKRYLFGRGKPLFVIQGLYSLIPGDAYLTTIRLDQQGRMVIEGKSRAMAIVFMLAGEMEESPLFKNVELRRTTKRDEAGKTLVDFEITCLLEEKKTP